MSENTAPENAAPENAAPESAAPASTGDPREDAKSKMREALERKKQHAHGNAAGRRNGGAVHGSQVAPGEGRRVFRRKSG